MHFSILKKLYLKEGQMNKVKLGKKQLLYYSFMKCFRIFPIDRKKIVVSNFRGKGYGDNPKYIIENLRNCIFISFNYSKNLV